MNRTAVAAMIAAVAGTAVAQPVQWRVEDGGNGHWYEAITATPFSLNWMIADGLANSAGGHLVTLTSEEEAHFVWIHLASKPQYWRQFMYFDGPLIGARRVGGQWEWVTGEAFGMTHWGSCFPSGSTETVAGYGCTSISDRWNNLDPDNNSPFSAIIEWSADCNADGIVDKGQILAGDLPDTNSNGIPDGPSIDVQPTDQSVSVGNAATFIVQVAAAPACTTPVTYQWQRRNPAVADPAALGAWIDLADDATFSGVQARNLSITNPIPALATGYRCKIGGGCGCEPNPGGFVYTNTVNFNIACPADFNADGGVDFTDVEAFFERWENGC